MMNYNIKNAIVMWLNSSYKDIRVLSMILILTFSSIFASESDTIYISKYDKEQDYSIVDKIRILEDSTRSLTIEEIPYISGFAKTSKDILDYEANKSTYWLKFTIVNTDEFSQSKRYVLFTTVDIHEFRFYHFDEKNVLKAEFNTGNIFPYKEQPLYTHGFTFPISLEPKSVNTFYVYLDHKHQIISTDVRLLTYKKLIEESTDEFFQKGLILGSMIMFLLIAASLLLFFRQTIHLNYFIYLIGVMIFLLSFNSGSRYVWNHWPYFQDPSQYIGPSVLMIGFIGVFRLFFHLRQYSRFLDRFFQGLRLIILLLIIGFLFWKKIEGYYTILYIIMSFLYFVCSILFVVISIYIYIKERKEEYLWFITSMVLLIITSSFILLTENTSLDREDFEFAFKYLPEITLYYESTILCFFLVRRVYREKLIYERKVFEERERIQRGLHDEVLTGLAGINMAFTNLIDELDQTLKTKLSNIRDRIENIVNDIREVLNYLSKRAKYLDDIIAEIRRFTLEQFEGQKIKSHFNTKIPEKDLMLPIQLRRHLKGFFKEIIHNCVKYSKAENFWIDIEKKANKLICLVCDDGIGFDYQKGLEQPIGAGNGLLNLEKRAERMKARYIYETHPGKGVKILLEIDFKKFSDADYI